MSVVMFKPDVPWTVNISSKGNLHFLTRGTPSFNNLFLLKQASDLWRLIKRRRFPQPGRLHLPEREDVTDTHHSD